MIRLLPEGHADTCGALRYSAWEGRTAVIRCRRAAGHAGVHAASHHYVDKWRMRKAEREAFRNYDFDKLKRSV